METPSTDLRKWYAIYVRSRFERKVDHIFRQRKIESFLPVIEEVRLWSDRKKRIQMPLFPGYVFVRIDIKDRLEALMVDGVVRFVGTSGRASRIPEEQINWVKILAGHPETLVHEKKLPVGEEVKVIAGPFRGVHGIVYGNKGNTRVVITVEVIAQSVSVEVSPEFVERMRK